MKDGEYEVSFMHFRFPKGDWPEKGEPDTAFVVRYMRGEGFVVDSQTELMFSNEWDNVDFSQPNPRGGFTVCNIRKDGRVVSHGEAFCSMSDNFCYRIGRHISEGRALERLTMEASHVDENE